MAPSEELVVGVGGGGPLRILWQRFGPVHPYRGPVRGTDSAGLPGLPGAWPQPLSGVDNALRTGLDLLPTWALEQKPAANRQVIAVLGGRLERGMPVVPMHGPLGWPSRNGRPRSLSN